MMTPSSAISAYIHAKDGNRPWLLREAFSESIALDMVVETDAIAFPPKITGRDAVADVLVKRFALEYENIFTFCLTSPPPDTEVGHFSCDWLVGMSGRADGAVRVGCGRYDWGFAEGRVESLTITIAAMWVFPADCLTPIMAWLTALPYPWCPADEAARNMPKLPELGEIADYMGRAP